MTVLTPPARLDEAQRYGLPLAHAAYRVGRDGQLLHAEADRSGVSQRDMMVVSCEEMVQSSDAAALARAILTGCKARGFGAVVCDFEPPVQPVLAQTVRRLVQGGRTVLVHEAYAAAAREARVLIPTAVSGGTLAARLTGAVARYGTGRVVLAVERVFVDFHLPARHGNGVRMSRKEHAALVRRVGPSVFFSDALCAHYFTYRAQSGGHHFVLFDDGQSVKAKLALARAHGIQSALLPYPEVEDILDEVMG